VQSESKAVEVLEVTKYYAQRGETVKAVDGVSFSLDRAEILGIIGESGCGKSTLGRVLIKLEDPSSGTIMFNGIDAKEVYRKDALKFRRTTQMVFQNPYDTFDPRHTIRRVLTDALRVHSIGETNQERVDICLARLETAGLTPATDFIDRYPHELSGGQLQRVSILRSMLLDPLFVVADEPVSMLDVSIRADIINALMQQCALHQSAMVFISHDISTTRYISNRIAVMYLGRFVEMGDTDEVLHRPAHPYTRALISNCASLDPRHQPNRIRIEGEPPTPVDMGPGCRFAPRCYRAMEICHSESPSLQDIGGGHCIACHFPDPADNEI